MKLRIRGNSLRLRLGRQEIEQLAAGGLVEDKVQFGPDPRQTFHYSIAWREQEMPLMAEFEDSTIQVFVRRNDADRLMSDDEIGLDANQSVGEGRILHLLVEKDFACLRARADEDDTHAFANPAACKNEQ